jgi:hypothetical protein
MHFSDSSGAAGGSSSTPSSLRTRTSVTAPASVDEESRLGGDDGASPRASASVSASLSALILPVYLPRAILSTGAGLTVVTRPLFARHLGCDDTQTGLIAAAVPLVRAFARCA